MPLLKNPYTNQIPQSVTPERAVELRRRGWVDVEAAPAPTPPVVDEASTVAAVRETADWLIAEAQWKSEQVQAELETRPTVEQLEQLQTDLQSAQADRDRALGELETRPTVEQLEQLQTALDKAQDDLTKPAEATSSDTTPLAGDAKPKAPAARKRN